MKYEEAFVSGFADEMGKRAWVGAALRAIPAAAKAVGGFIAKKAPAALTKAKSFVKNAPSKAWSTIKKNPATTAMVGSSLIPRGKPAKPMNTAPQYQQKVARLL